MRKLINIFLIIFASYLFAGCKKTAIDFVPQNQLSSTSFWKTEKDVRLALTGCYGYLNGGYGYAYDDAAADNAFAQYPWESTATSVSAGDINATIDVGYGGRYTSVRRFNYFLANVGNVQMDPNLKKRYIAEVRVLRAFTYFELARAFGSVPLLKDAYDDPQATAIASSPVADVINYATTEIQAVAADLPASYPGGAGNETGRITSGAAWAILTRMQLHYGKWADAVASAQKVMTAGYKLFRVTSLTPDDTKDDYSSYITFANEAEKQKFYKGMASYEQQFWAANEATSKEIILASQNITNSSYEYGNGLRTLFLPASLSAWSSITPTQDLINAYWNKNGVAFTPPTAANRATNYNSGNPNAAFFTEFKNRDTRLYASVLFPGVTANRFDNGYVYSPGTDEKTGYNFKKLVDPAYLANDWDGAQDFPIIRYAEILLSFAEAKNELSGPDGTIFDALDDIRDRAGMPTIVRANFATKELLRELIRNERRIELAGEGQRFYDIRRWNIAKDVMKTPYDLNNRPVQNRVWQDKFVLMPYPQVALDRNSNLKAAQATKGY